MSEEKCPNCGGNGQLVCPACGGMRELSKGDGQKRAGNLVQDVEEVDNYLSTMSRQRRSIKS